MSGASYVPTAEKGAQHFRVQHRASEMQAKIFAVSRKGKVPKAKLLRQTVSMR